MESVVSQYWNIPPARGTLVLDRPDVTLVIDDTLPPHRRAIHLVEFSGMHRFSVTPEVADAAGLRDGTVTEPDAIAAAIDAATVGFHEWEQVFYLPAAAREILAEAPDYRGLRRLTEDDAEAFKAFQAANSKADLEEAFVELDHWFVLGAIAEDGALLVETPGEAASHHGIIAAASIYPWDESKLADIGVLVEPGSRGRGLAVTLVQAACAATLARGFEPQYRCQLGNDASRATALRAGFTLFGTWRVVNGEAPGASTGAVH